MKLLHFALLSFCLLGCGNATAVTFSDRIFDQDLMITTPYSIMILSTFEDEDHITAYSDYGNLLWDVTFTSKIISWKIKDGFLYVFSKTRYLEKTYLHCMDPANGKVIWERS